MGARGYKLVDLRLDGSGPPHPMRMQTLRSVSLSEMSSAPPPIEGGTSTLQVGASATIALER